MVSRKLTKRECQDLEEFENKTQELMIRRSAARSVYKNVKEFRKRMSLIHDDPDRDKWLETCADSNDSDRKVKIFFFLLNTLRTTDGVVIEVFQKLFEKHDSFLDWLLEVDETELQNLIKRCGFQNTTANNMKKCAETISKMEGRIPSEDFDTLISGEYPGCGSKCALIYLKDGCGDCQGIPHDVHVEKLCGIQEIVTAKDREVARLQLQVALDDETTWEDFNEGIGGLGQMLNKAKMEKDGAMMEAMMRVAVEMDNKVEFKGFLNQFAKIQMMYVRSND